MTLFFFVKPRTATFVLWAILHKNAHACFRNGFHHHLMDHTNNQTAPSSTAQPSTNIGDDFGDLDEALLSQILDDEDELDLPAKSQTSSNQSGPEQQQTSVTSTTPVDTPSSRSSFTQADADESALLSSDDEDCKFVWSMCATTRLAQLTRK